MREHDTAIAVPALRTLTPQSSWLLRYARSYPGRLDQVRQARIFLREILTRRPRADDAVAIASELAANACLHSKLAFLAEYSPSKSTSARVTTSTSPSTTRADPGIPSPRRAARARARPSAGHRRPEHWGLTGDASGRQPGLACPGQKPTGSRANLPHRKPSCQPIPATMRRRAPAIRPSPARRCRSAGAGALHARGHQPKRPRQRRPRRTGRNPPRAQGPVHIAGPCLDNGWYDTPPRIPTL